VITFGLEIEVFLKQKDELILVPPGYPKDSEGFQLEIRGEPFSDPWDAVSNAEGKLKKLQTQLERRGITICNDPVVKVDKSLRIKARRENEKGCLRYKNLYGYLQHRVGPNVATAGIHISITDGREKQVEGKSIHYNHMLDFPSWIKFLDKEFQEEIKGSQRYPGFYEIKSDGRVEYRSLPCNVDLLKLAETLAQSIKHL
jgi:hypothetical protein